MNATWAPLRRALAAGLPVVIVSAPLELPAGDKIGYILNDDDSMGELAAAQIATLIGGKRQVAMVGLARYAPGATARACGAERFLANRFPAIQVVSRAGGAYTSSRAEELTNDALNSHPGLKAILSLTAVATRGAHAALKSRPLQEPVGLVGCGEDSDLIGYVGIGDIDAILAENTYRMGYEAYAVENGQFHGGVRDSL